MQKFRSKALIFFILILCMAPFSAYAETAIVNTKSLKVRSGPGLTYDVIGSVSAGEEVTIHQTQDDWYQIDYKGLKGWIASWLTTGSKNAVQGQSAIVQVKKLNVRFAATQSSALVGQLQLGQSVPVLSKKNDWVEITFNGTSAWIHKDYIQLVATTSEQKSAQAPEEGVFIVQVDGLNVRKKPNLDSKRIAVVYRNESYPVVSLDSTWVGIELEDGSTGYVYRFYGNFQQTETKQETSDEVVTILYNGTNLRDQPSTSSSVAARVDAGQKLSVVEAVNDWYQVEFNGKRMYLANWVVTTGDLEIKEQVPKKKQQVRKQGTLNGLQIVIDPGHGGNDDGTTGYYGTDEKGLTLPTAELLAAKLEASGAEVVFTRQSDTYVSLRKRVSVSHQVAADAFISIHYDSVDNSSVNGFTTYYQHGFQKPLADAIHASLEDRLSLKDRGVREGNYLVLRENKQMAVLLELGYLSNATEERTITTAQFRETAAHAIYEGVINYFDSQLGSE